MPKSVPILAHGTTPLGEKGQATAERRSRARNIPDEFARSSGTADLSKHEKGLVAFPRRLEINVLRVLDVEGGNTQADIESILDPC
jgi:hypothetical protein